MLGSNMQEPEMLPEELQRSLDHKSRIVSQCRIQALPFRNGERSIATGSARYYISRDDNLFFSGS